MPGYWRRPIARVYNYNLDLGENYYAPMREYVDSDRRTRGETPGALSYSERMARRWCGGGDKERELRAKTEAFERESIREAIRATSEIRREVTPNIVEQKEIKSIRSATENADAVLNKHRRMISDISDETNRRVRDINTRYEDNISKKLADIRLSPWRGDELETEYRTNKESRARIHGLERELDEITRSAMSYRSYSKSAKELASDALKEDALTSSSSKRTKRVTYDYQREPMKYY